MSPVGGHTATKTLSASVPNRPRLRRTRHGRPGAKFCVHPGTLRACPQILFISSRLPYADFKVPSCAHAPIGRVLASQTQLL